LKTVWSPRHAEHGARVELDEGALVAAHESPARAEIVRARIAEVGLGPLLEPEPQQLDAARRVHDPGYLDFLAMAWQLWTDAGRGGTALPMAWPVGDLRRDAAPAQIDGLLGYYSYDAGSGFVAGTWGAVRAAHDAALTAAGLVADGEDAAFALCRPPGHHAGRRTMGGYCFINNAAVAAERLRERGADRVSILDIDYHHGNGTQEIFYRRGDVQVVSLHADPRHEYPYFLGHSNERGAGTGEGANLNLPMPLGTDFEGWRSALEIACAAVAAYRPDALVVSLGVDTFEGDPISRFRLQSDDFPRVGARIAGLGLPTLFVMEGGYAVAEIGVNVVSVLTGFEQGP